MARKIRIEYRGTAYHGLARGNQGRDIYADEQDSKLWLATLAEACEKTGWCIHAWVMIGNHYHLLSETPEPNLEDGMKWFPETLLLASEPFPCAVSPSIIKKRTMSPHLTCAKLALVTNSVRLAAMARMLRMCGATRCGQLEIPIRPGGQEPPNPANRNWGIKRPRDAHQCNMDPWRPPYVVDGVRSALFALALLSGACADTLSAAPLNLTVPELARTSSTILLLWDRAPAADVADYSILRDEIQITRTRQFSLTVSGLEPGRTYRFAVRAIDATGKTILASAEVKAATKASGPVLDVRAHGALGDGRHEDTAAIQATVNACPPGGTVLVPPGDYLVNHLELRGNLTVNLTTGAMLRFLGREASKPVRGAVEVEGLGGTRRVDYGALITAVHADHLTLTGGGIIDGNGPTWWTHLDAYRPRLLQIVASRNVFVQGLTLQDPPKFNTLLSDVEDAVFSGVTFLKRTAQASANGDGLDPDSSRNLLIVGCNFGNQDDSIAIKAGLVDESAKVRPRASENIIVRDCRFDGGLAPGSHPLGIAIGSGASGGVRHVLVKDCEFINAASLANLRINRSSRYGLVEDVRFERCTYSNTTFPDEPWNRAPISLDLFYYALKSDDPDVPKALSPGTPCFRDIEFRNIVIKNPRGRAVYISGLAEKPLRNISFIDVTAKAKFGFFARNVDGITLTRVAVAAESGPAFDWGANIKNRLVTPAPPTGTPSD
jgi:exo-poly-alpha-galacturonosidase